MTYLKIIFLLIIALLDRCGVIRRPAPVSEDGQEVVYSQPTVSPDGTWRLADESENAAQADTYKLSEATLFNFFPDSTFSEVKSTGEFVTGNWHYVQQDSMITITIGKKPVNYKISTGHDENAVNFLVLTDPQNHMKQFGAFGRKLEAYPEDPFYPANNLWRSKPAAAENKQQILARLRGYLLHSAYLLKAADVRKQQIISWEFSKGIIKIYRSGIGIVKREDIPVQWMSNFHSEQDALFAHAILEDFLLTTSYKGEATENWVKDDYNILMSTYERLGTRNLASIKHTTKKESR
jgi:hypothetical protein